MNKRRVRALFVLAGLVLIVRMTTAETPARKWEEMARAVPEAPRIRGYMQRMSAEPHHAGSPQSRAVAEYALGLFREWGLDARIETFEALLPYPAARTLEIVEPVFHRARLEEPALSPDGDSGDARQLPTYNAYSASGEVTAPVVYVNYGLTEDYDHLERLGISVKGTIVIARYGKSWRGTKPKIAAERGAAACLIYSDPRDDGYFQGDVYPAGPFRPPHGVQRGSVMDMPLYVGDPLSPGWASEPGARKLDRSEAQTLMKIPVLPLSYDDASAVLRQLGGPVAPEPWRGALGFTYHVGPGPAKVHLKVDFDWSNRPVHNVIATMRGEPFPDQWILYGNHHDAWVNGANDPLSGASALLETARTLAHLRKAGWRPQRSILFALWDAEEFGLIGSTEWVEKHREELDRKLAVYLNSDTTGKGPIRAGGSHSLEKFLQDLLRDFPDPESGKSLFDAAQARRPKGSGEFRLSPLGAGSDYVAFLHHAGIASLNLGFDGEGGGVYHSIYDSFHWYTSFSDKEFLYGKAFSGLMATALIRLAGARLLPFEFGRLASRVQEFAAAIRKDAGKQAHQLEWKEMEAAIRDLTLSAKRLDAALEAAGDMDTFAPDRLGALNEAIFRTERALILEAGLPGRPWYKHQIYAPGLYTGYSAKTLPGVREAAEAKQWREANTQSRQAAQSLRALSAALGRIAGMLKQTN
jgi:N-acetylated-alpha-linked acidic dipeptidase